MAEDITRFFTTDEKNNCVWFTGDKLEVYIPDRYRKDSYLVIDDKVHALGIFTMVINGSITCGLRLPGIITMDTADITEITRNGEKFVVAELQKGSRFMTSLGVIKNDKISYFMWVEFLTFGHMPSFVDYNTAAMLFDDNQEFTGSGIGVDHVIYEVIIAHCFRDAQDKNIPYRHTAMTRPPVQVTLKDISYGAQTTHSRVIGSYQEEGMISAALNQVKENHALEDLFRS